MEENNTVYILNGGPYGDYQNLGVYYNEKDAEEAQTKRFKTQPFIDFIVIERWDIQ